MTNPRNVKSFDLPGDVVTATYDNSTILYSAAVAKGSAGVGLAVKISAAGVVALAADGDRIFGKLALVEPDGSCAVIVSGGVCFPGGDSAALTAGRAFVGALNASSAPGYIRAVGAPAGTYGQAAATDAGRGRGNIIDGSTTTEVWVWL